MKFLKLNILVLVGIILFISCKNDDDSTPSASINGIWHVKNISGGFAGIDDDYETGIITWTFNNQTLIVENNAFQDNIFNGLETGTYNYTSNEINGTNYLIINTTEFGGYTLTISNLTINQNNISTGSGADGFVLQFEK